MNNFQITKNFNLQEFICKDGSELVKLDEALVSRLQMLRNIVARPITVLSGYRTPDYNKKVGGSPKSQHMLGKAADIRVEGYSLQKLAVLAENVGFKGIGIYETFIHVDVRENKARWNG